VSETTIHELKSLLFSLIRCNTVNPPGNSREAIDLIAEYLKNTPADIKIIEAWDDKNKTYMYNLIAEYSTGSGKTLIFNGHHDVVPPGANWSYDPFKPVEENGWIIGRGASDMKGGIAAMVYAFKHLCENPDFKGKLVLSIVADEEIDSSAGTRYLLEKGLLKGDYAIVGESTGLNIVTARKGVIWVKIKTLGVAAHGSKPHLGVNAIEKMAKIIERLSKLRWSIRHPRLGKPTMNFGIIRGGTSINTVADECELLIDMRAIPGQKIEDIKKRICGEIEKIRLKDKDLKYEIELIDVFPPYEIDRKHKLVKIARKTVKEITGKTPKLLAKPGSSDVVFLAEKGIASIDLGPTGRNAHGANEAVNFESVAKLSEIYIKVAKRILK